VARAPVCILLPTFTYQVYGSFVRPGRTEELRERAMSWRALVPQPDAAPEFGLSSYNYHSDGSGVMITSLLRPMLDTRPKQISLFDKKGSGCGRIACDSYLVHWLEHLGQEYEVVTDHDLHDEGAELLKPYRVVLTGQHPEYYSTEMLDGLEGFLAGGGRLMYLGGNGFYWKSVQHKTVPTALELRRTESGIRVWPSEPGEYYHGFNGDYGGLWVRQGRAPNKLVGIAFSSQGFYSGFPYRFTDGIRDPRVAFILEGIDGAAAPGTIFGDFGWMGGGAAGFELDRADRALGTPPHAVVIAKGQVDHPDYGPVNEDMLIHRPPKPLSELICADMTFFETRAGGAVFSVGSMTYLGSLGWKGYDNMVAKLTTNVLRRFLDERRF
jgi:N,N-dimethylformamidase